MGANAKFWWSRKTLQFIIWVIVPDHCFIQIISARTTGAIANDLEDVIDCEMDQLEIRTSHLSKNNKPFHDKMGRRFKPSTAPIKYDVIVSDIDQENTILSPTPISPLNLTEHVIHHYFQKPVNKDRRIAKWLVECEEKKQNQLPAHLPDISASNRNVTVTFEELWRHTFCDVIGAMAVCVKMCRNQY